MAALIIKAIFKIAKPFLNLNIKNNTRYTSMNITGSNAGQAFRLSKILPLSSPIIALCVPHPGHSMPKRVL